MMSSGRSPQLLFIILVLLSLFSIQNVFGFNSGVEEDGNIIKCIESERHALLMFKQGLIDDFGLLSSWGDDEDKKECCKWRGVSCSNRTGHVIKLNLQGSFDFPQKYLRGNLSSSLLELQQLNYLDLSYNDFGGQPIPEFFGSLNKLRHLNLSNSVFGGRVPYQLGNLSRLQSLDLSNSGFRGPIPYQLGNLSRLQSLDLGYNHGDSLPYLIVLAFRSNRFNGSIPLQLCQLSNIQFVDFSLNNISGTIPKCLNNLTALMVQELSLDSTISITYASTSLSDGQYLSEFEVSAIIVWKGMDRQYKENLGYLKCIDLSSNKLSGEIPVEITTLEGLRSLNLSRNSLIGPITPEIGSLNLLDSLDLSNNQLIGEIPPSFSSLNFLGMLNLSNNNLSGKIPLGTQLQSFDANSYMGNPQLCGSPLNKCQEGEAPAIITHYGNNEDVIVTLEFYVCVAIGFIVGFWGVVGSLILNRSWRHAYFQFLNQTKDRLYVAMVLNIAKLQRRPMNYDR